MSIYLPDRAIPMLPRELSSHLASLVPNEDRLCLAVEVELGPSGGIRRHRYVEGLMRSAARLTYDGVARALRLTELPEPEPEAEKRIDMLRVLLEASQRLRLRRSRRGSLDFDLPEARVKLDPESGEPVDVYRSRRDPGVRKAYQLIEDMMLLANEVVAGDLSRRGIPTIYRVHGTPKEEKLEVFADLASSLGYVLDPEAATSPKLLSRFLGRIEGTPHAQVLSYLLLRSMQQATYDVTNIGHFGLAAKEYLHFTSPIRRYPDLAVHRVLRSVIRDEALDPDREREKLRLQALESSRLERRAMVVERNVVDLYRAVLMRDRVGEEFPATITNVEDWGFYSAFDEPYVEALTPVEALGDDYYETDELGVRLVGHRTKRMFAMGDRVLVRLETVNISDRRIIALPVADLPSDRTLFSHLDAAGPSRRGPRSQRGSGRDGGGGRGRTAGGAGARGSDRSGGRGDPSERRPKRGRKGAAKASFAGEASKAGKARRDSKQGPKKGGGPKRKRRK